MEPVRVVAVRYLNTVPLIEGLADLEGCVLELTAPSRIADTLRTDRADVGLVSVVDLVAGDGPALTALPVGMIGCAGPTWTVRLYSQTPPAEIRAVHADTDSHTSVVLARVILHALHGARPPVIDFDARERVVRDADAPEPERAADDLWPETLLMIGDKVMTDAPPEGLYRHEIDLGEAWHAWTGLPFVYAVWACRAEDAAPDAPRRRMIELASSLLERQRLHNRTRLDALAGAHAPRHRWRAEDARHYLGRLLRYDFDESAEQGARRFIDEAQRAGFLPAGELRSTRGLRPSPRPPTPAS